MKTWSECEVEGGAEVFAERIDDFGVDCRIRNYVASFSLCVCIRGQLFSDDNPSQSVDSVALLQRESFFFQRKCSGKFP